MVYAPSFGRRLEQPIAGSIPVLPSARLVITEGNYLLFGEPPWNEANARAVASGRDQADRIVSPG